MRRDKMKDLFISRVLNSIFAGEIYVFENDLYILDLEHVRMFILSSYVLLASINTIYKYGHA